MTVPLGPTGPPQPPDAIPRPLQQPASPGQPQPPTPAQPLATGQPTPPGAPSVLQLLAAGAPMVPLPEWTDADAAAGAQVPVTGASLQESASPPGILLAGASSPVDQIHIQPLDTAGALQILIAEVRAALPIPGDTQSAGVPPSIPGFTSPQASALASAGLSLAPTTATAPQSVVQLFLQSVPDPQTHLPAAWSAAVSRLEGALDLALGKGTAAVSNWHDVPASVVDAAQETRTAVWVALGDELPNPLMLRPEWLGLAPRLESFRRRRRRVRRLTDPDGAARWDDVGERGEDGADRPQT